MGWNETNAEKTHRLLQEQNEAIQKSASDTARLHSETARLQAAQNSILQDQLRQQERQTSIIAEQAREQKKHIEEQKYKANLKERAEEIRSSMRHDYLKFIKDNKNKIINFGEGDIKLDVADMELYWAEYREYKFKSIEDQKQYLRDEAQREKTQTSERHQEIEGHIETQRTILSSFYTLQWKAMASAKLAMSTPYYVVAGLALLVAIAALFTPGRPILLAIIFTIIGALGHYRKNKVLYRESTLPLVKFRRVAAYSFPTFALVMAFQTKFQILAFLLWSLKWVSISQILRRRQDFIFAEEITNQQLIIDSKNLIESLQNSQKRLAEILQQSLDRINEHFSQLPAEDLLAAIRRLN
jgi:hypothetical protein